MVIHLSLPRNKLRIKIVDITPWPSSAIYLWLERQFEKNSNQTGAGGRLIKLAVKLELFSFMLKSPLRLWNFF